MQLASKSLLFYLLILCCDQSLAEARSLRLAITHTTENSGLMDVLNPVFQAQHDVEMSIITVASGKALRLAESGEIDVLLTHAPDDEKQFIERGYGLLRKPVMHNDFILVGPVADPAYIADAVSIAAAYQQLSNSDLLYISRGDESGTHKKEQAILAANQIEADANWLISAASGMGAVLLMADQRGAYTLTDRGTFLALKDKLGLKIVYQDDARLRNPYHVMAVNPERHDNINYAMAERYIDFLTGDQAQGLIANFQIDGVPLFYPVNADVTALDSASNETQRGSFFIDAILSSVKLIADFDRDLFFVVWTSLKVSLLSVLIAAVISVPLGIMVALNSFAGKTFLQACLNTLMALPTVVVGLLLYGILNRQGLLGHMSLLYTPTAMVIGQCVLITPVIWNLSIAAVNGADPRLARTCSSLGANYYQRCLIYMSEVRFALIAAIVAGFGRAIGEVGIAMMLGGNIDGYTRTMTTAIALETSKGDFEFALALGFMLLLVAFVVNALLQQFQVRSR